MVPGPVGPAFPGAQVARGNPARTQRIPWGARRNNIDAYSVYSTNSDAYYGMGKSFVLLPEGTLYRAVVVPRAGP